MSGDGPARVETNLSVTQDRMHRYLSEEHKSLVEEVRAFARDVIAPIARAADESTEFPWESVKAMGEMGLLGIPVPVSSGVWAVTT